jgi:hypothetical protein
MEREFPGGRVMPGGSYAFWFNWFTPIPQMSGGFDQWNWNMVQRVAVFTIHSGMNAGPRDGEIATLWLKAFGVAGVHVPGPESAEYFKPFANPRKFEGLLKEVWREGGDRIYRVPLRSTAFAHVIPEESLVQTRPKDGLDVTELRRYVAALDSVRLPPATMTWPTPSRARIQANVPPGHVISVQVNHHPGWRANRAYPARDGLGLIVIRPERPGPADVTLEFAADSEAIWTDCASVLSLAGALFFMGLGILRPEERIPKL